MMGMCSECCKVFTVYGSKNDRSYWYNYSKQQMYNSTVAYTVIMGTENASEDSNSLYYIDLSDEF